MKTTNAEATSKEIIDKLFDYVINNLNQYCNY